MDPVRIPTKLAGLGGALLACSLAVGLWPQAVVNADEDEAAFRREAQRQIQELGARVEAIAPLEARVAVLEAAHKTATDRIASIEVQTGRSPFVAKHLKAATPATLTLVTGTQVASPSDRGKRRALAKHLAAYDGYVLAYWATWCKPCTSPEELRHLHTLQRALRRQGIELVSMAIDALVKVQEDPRAPTWLYPLWQRDDGHVEMLPQTFVSETGLGLPLFVVVSASGTIRHYRNAPLDAEVIREIVDAALDAKGR